VTFGFVYLYATVVAVEYFVFLQYKSCLLVCMWCLAPAFWYACAMWQWACSQLLLTVSVHSLLCSLTALRTLSFPFGICK